MSFAYTSFLKHRLWTNLILEKKIVDRTRKRNFWASSNQRHRPHSNLSRAFVWFSPQYLTARLGPPRHVWGPRAWGLGVTTGWATVGQSCLLYTCGDIERWLFGVFFCRPLLQIPEPRMRGRTDEAGCGFVDNRSIQPSHIIITWGGHWPKLHHFHSFAFFAVLTHYYYYLLLINLLRWVQIGSWTHVASDQNHAFKVPNFGSGRYLSLPTRG